MNFRPVDEQFALALTAHRVEASSEHGNRLIHARIIGAELSDEYRLLARPISPAHPSVREPLLSDQADLGAATTCSVHNSDNDDRDQDLGDAQYPDTSERRAVRCRFRADSKQALN